MSKISIKKKQNPVSSKKPTSTNSTHKALVPALFLGGISLMVWEISIYDDTMIDFKIPLSIWLIPGIILTPILFNKMNSIADSIGHWFWHYFLHTGIAGSLLVFTFMATNYYFAGGPILQGKFKVIGRGTFSKGQPYAIINYQGLEKQLHFKKFQAEQVESAQFIKLQIKKGFFGYDVVEKIELE